jgi:hypothetical protein
MVYLFGASEVAGITDGACKDRLRQSVDVDLPLGKPPTSINSPRLV